MTTGSRNLSPAPDAVGSDPVSPNSVREDSSAPDSPSAASLEPGSLVTGPPSLGFGGWAELLKLRITTFVAIAATTGGLLAAPDAQLVHVLGAAFWIALSSAGASVFNQVLERDTDALMERTAERPLVTGAIGLGFALVLGGALTVASTVGLVIGYGWTAGLLALGTLLTYVLIYTPLKRLSTLNTVVGALPGAMAPLIGAVAIAGEPGIWGYALFANLFVWQFPHFMAIAWLYRVDYARAGLKMLPTVPGGEALAGRQAFLQTIAILPTGLLPLLESKATWLYAFGSTAVGIAYLVAAFAFMRSTTVKNARRLLHTSLVYLPVLYGVALFDRIVLTF